MTSPGPVTAVGTTAALAWPVTAAARHASSDVVIAGTGEGSWSGNVRSDVTAEACTTDNGDAGSRTKPNASDAVSRVPVSDDRRVELGPRLA